VWHHALNNDLPITPVGGEDSITNLHRIKLVGSVRTYAYVGQNLTAAAWIEALKQGKTFFSSGPLLEFRANQSRPGESLRLPAEGGMVTLEGKVWSIVPLDRVVIYRNGKGWKEIPLDPERKSAIFSHQIQMTESAWLSLTAEGSPSSHPLDVNYPQAATNAIRVYVGAQKIRNRQSAEYFIHWIDKLQNMANHWFGWRSQAEKDHVFRQFDEARRVYQRLAQEADSH
jgi:hypothetical protein